MQNIFKVYIIREKLTNEIKYAGLTRQTLETRFNGHIQRKKLNRSKYQMELIQENLSLEQAVILEKMLIANYKLLENGWNKSPGSIDGNSQYHSEKQKEKWRKERPGKPVSLEHAKKNRIARLGYKNSPESCFKRQIAMEKKVKSVICIETGIIYKSIHHAGRELNLRYSKISLVCNGKRNTTGNLHFKFIETVETNRND